ncbi:hypothetical protein ScPMuIL_015697 [Solemya velum]
MNGAEVPIGSLQNLITMEMFPRNQIMNIWRGQRFQHVQRIQDVPFRDRGGGGPRTVRHERVNVDGDILSYIANDSNKVGLYIAAGPLNPEENYFEVELLDTGVNGSIGVGLVPYRYPLDSQPGWMGLSVGYLADDGKLLACGMGNAFGPKCNLGDKMGCGIRFQTTESGGPAQSVRVFFTRNGKEIGTVMVPYLPGGLFPAVGMHSDGEEVKLNLEAEWTHDDIILMAIDNGEEEWSRLHDVRLNGALLEYAGRGKSVHDVGMAQAKLPLDTTNHYYEIEIVDPGQNCYIAIGLARRNYPKHRHPGWNTGSIAYHADDGKIFVGSGVGDPFGPRCYKGDIMGCGILFPPDYDSELDSYFSPEELENAFEQLDEGDTDSDDDDLWGRVPVEEKGTKVQVFFTRNGKIIGQKHVHIPRGGFYPTVGMLSSCEKVRIDLRPMTG